MPERMLKYIRRIEEKDSDILNLEKARWYLDREIETRKANRQQALQILEHIKPKQKRKLTKAVRAAIAAGQRKRWERAKKGR